MAKVEGWPVSEPERGRVAEWEGLRVSGAAHKDIIKEREEGNKRRENLTSSLCW